MNSILTLTHNCLEMTKRAVDSFLQQDIPVETYVIDNGSTDGTLAWLQVLGLLTSPANFNQGVSVGWNCGLRYLFETLNASHVLVSNNDVVLPHWFYRELLSYDVPFVSGISVDDMKVIEKQPGRMPLSPSPDFSAFLIRREAWQAVGPFDESMKFYASDNDWHARAHRAGVRLWKANVPFYHERSSTLGQAPPEERQEICDQADRDREVFLKKYGVLPWGPGYDELFK